MGDPEGTQGPLHAGGAGESAGAAPEGQPKPRQHRYAGPGARAGDDIQTPPSFDPASATRDVLARCAALGFAAAGIAPATESAQHPSVLEWLAAGSAGVMDYLQRDQDLRARPALLLEQSRAFVMVADVYAPRGQGAAEPAEPGVGKIARYARGRDYHRVIKQRLHRLCDDLRAAYPGSEFRAFVDTAPVLERELAMLAGLGWQAKNTMLIHPRLGSYVLLAGVATTLPLIAEAPRIDDACGTCTRCIDACPTGAITPYRVDATRCVSYLTIELDADVPEQLREGIGDWLYGCDICQEVCPHNSPRPEEAGPPTPAHEAYAPRATSLPLLGVLGWTQSDRQRAFAVSAMKRVTLAQIKRNALLVAANQLRRAPEPTLLDRVRQIARDEHEPPIVRAAAAWVLTQASRPTPGA